MSDLRRAVKILIVLLGAWRWLPAVGLEYRVGVADVLRISVLDHAEMTNTYTVSPDGRIAFPFLGTVPVKDQTLDAITASLTQKLKEGYLRYPVVTVALEKPANNVKIFVYGEVRNPGEYTLTGDKTTVLQAIVLAGGLAKSGSESKITVLRQKEDGSTYQPVKVDLHQVIAGQQEDPVLQAKDILIIRQGWF